MSAAPRGAGAARSGKEPLPEPISLTNEAIHPAFAKPAAGYVAGQPSD